MITLINFGGFLVKIGTLITINRTIVLIIKWLCIYSVDKTRNHKVVSSSSVTAMSSLGIGSLHHNYLLNMTRWICN